MKETAHKIKFKVPLPLLNVIFFCFKNSFCFVDQVVKRQAVIPFVSEAPTILLGAEMSSCTGDGSRIVSVSSLPAAIIS